MRYLYDSSLTNILGAFSPIKGTGSLDKPGIEYRGGALWVLRGGIYRK